MTVVRVAKRENPYVLLDKTVLDDTRLSWKAKGLHAYLVGKPDGWKVRIKDLVKHATDGRDACYAALKELEDLGYLKRYPVKDEKGIIRHWESIIYETPLPGYPDTAQPDTAQPDTANPEILISNEKYQSTTDSNARSFSESAIAIASAVAEATDANEGSAPPLGATRPHSASEGVEEADLLSALRKHCKVNASLKQFILANLDAAKFALKELEYAISEQIEVKNPAAFFRSEMKSHIARHSKNSPQSNKTGHQPTSGTPNVETPSIDLPPVSTAEELGNVATEIRSWKELEGSSAGTFFYVEQILIRPLAPGEVSLPNEVHLYQMKDKFGWSNPIVKIATGEKSRLTDVLTSHHQRLFVPRQS